MHSSKPDGFKNLLNWEGIFRNSSAESDFQRTKNQYLTKRIRVVSILTGLAYFGGIFSDKSALAGSNIVSTMLILRSITFLFAIISFISTYSKHRVKITPWITFLYFIVISMSECTELLLRPELSNQASPVLGFVIILYYVFIPVRLSLHVTGGLFASILYTIYLSMISNNFSIIFVVVSTFILVNLLGAYISRFMNVSKRMEFNNLSELMRTNDQLKIEIDERKKVSELLLQMATIDDLTQIFNRRHFIELVNNELLKSRESALPASLLFIDIDFFKSINDTYGHSLGDMVLQRLAKEISSNILDSYIFGRFGGEEFALFLPDCDPETARKYAEKICTMVSNFTIPIQLKDSDANRKSAVKKNQIVRTTISIGIANCTPDTAEDFDTLMKYADLALYKAKAEGRNRVIVWNG